MASESSFLGTGWRFPPGFTLGGANVEMVSEAEDMHQSLQIILSTQPGERILQEKFGCDMNGFQFEPIEQGLINSLHRVISDALLYHEPRIDLERLLIRESDTEQGLLLISIDYRIRSTNSRYNMIYPFYLTEANVSLRK
ncbi:MAG: GPW/gp25 family protein [Gammaproteobacteria bacterium]|nr:GPW/gp25 family protein [Gammaproteobacteria bacterium]